MGVPKFFPEEWQAIEERIRSGDYSDLPMLRERLVKRPPGRPATGRVSNAEYVRRYRRRLRERDQ